MAGAMQERSSPSYGSEARGDSFEALLRDPLCHSPRVGATWPPLAPGAVVCGGRLSILRKLGEGGNGAVYEAFDADRKVRVACKTLRKLDPAGVYRLKNEFRGLADVRHPNLVALHELFADGDTWLFTMDLIEGERFDRYIRHEGRCDEGRLRAALPQLVSAIGAIHAAGKLHRDLKPSNVLVDGGGRIIVLDFGLAVDVDPGGVGQTIGDESVSGTPAYMAPEQAAGASATAASDLYAMGVMVFEAITGTLPFTGRSGEILAAKQQREAPAASATRDVAPDLGELCAQLLARDGAARPSLDTLQRVHGLRHQPSASVTRCAAQPVKLFGRDAELRALHRAFAETQAGNAVVMRVAGAPGVGKSILVASFLSSLRVQGHTVVLAGRCDERENVPFKAFDALIDDLSRHMRKLQAHEAALLLPRDVSALARVFPVLDRVEVVASAPKRAAFSADQLLRRALAVFAEMLARIRDRQPLVVFIDDLQWIDRDSLQFLRGLLAQLRALPILLIVAHRTQSAGEGALLQSAFEAASGTPRLDIRSLEIDRLASEPERAVVHAEQGALSLR